MNIIDRYILRTHVAPFLFGVSLIIFLFLLQFIIKYIDQFVGKGLDLWVIIQLIVMNMAWMIVLAIPIGVLFSTLMSFGSMASVHEITIIKSSGGSLIRMMFPVFIIGVGLSLWLFWFNDQVLPDSNHRAKILLSDIQRKKPTFTLESGKFSSDFEGYTIFARKVDSISGALHGVTIYDHRNMNEYNIASADSGKAEFSFDMTKLIFTLFNGESHQFKPDNLKEYRIVNFLTYRVLIDAHGFEFQRTSESFMSRGDREMKIKDMRKITNEATNSAKKSRKKINTEYQRQYKFLTSNEPYTSYSTGFRGYVATGASQFERDTTKPDSLQQRIAALKQVEKRISFLKSAIQSDISQIEDYSATARQYEVEIQKKYAIPFACIVFILLGCPLGIKTRGGNFGISAAITLAFYIIYWACLIGGEKLADRGFLSPILSMWSANIILGIAGIILVLRINNESLSMPFSKLINKIMSKWKKV